MSEGKTGGRRAYEAWNGGAVNEQHSAICWENNPGMRPRWEAAAAAGAAAAHERTAELVSEVNELRAEVAELRRTIRNINDARYAIGDAECPIEARFPGEVWPCTYRRGHAGPHSFVDSIVRDEPDAEPAVVTSGTEHLAKLIGGLAIGGEEPA